MAATTQRGPARRAARRGRPPVSEAERDARRLEISRHAVRLFRAQGVDATSGRQIAAAAEVSERTLWRLFRVKEACAAPLLAHVFEEFRRVLAECPPERPLDEHLRAHYTFVPAAVPDSDADAVLAVLRMTRDEPALRAVWLLLQDRSEPVLAAVLARRAGLPADAPEIRTGAASVNAVLRVVIEDYAERGAGADEAGRGRLADAFRAAARGWGLG